MNKLLLCLSAIAVLNLSCEQDTEESKIDNTEKHSIAGTGLPNLLGSPLRQL